jgi:hypothetical protein
MLCGIRLFAIDAEQKPKPSIAGGAGLVYTLDHLCYLYDCCQLRTKSSLGAHRRTMLEYGEASFLQSTPSFQNSSFVQYLRWQLIAAFHIITEICLFMLVLYLVHGLQMQLKKKAIVVTSFGLRLL